MTVLFRVRIEGEIYRVHIDVPDDLESDLLRDLEAFAVRTVQLERSGYIPSGTLNAVDALRPCWATHPDPGLLDD